MCGFLKGISNLPIIGGAAKGLDQVISRPGDLVNNPGQFMSNVAGGAAPFFMGPLAGAVGTGGMLPGWATSLMGAAGSAGGQGGQNPNTPWANAGMGAYNLFKGNATDNGYGAIGLNYADKFGNAGNQLLDKAMAPQEQDPYEDYLGSSGRDFLRQGNLGPTRLEDMGVLSNMQGIMGQMADQSGVANPFTNQGGGNAQGGQAQNPYDLHPHEQEAFNTTAQMVNQGRQAAIGQLKQQMAAKGITDPRAMAAAEAAINAGHNTMLTDTHSKLQSQAFQNRQNTLGQFSQMMPQLYGYQNQNQQQNIGNALNLMGAQNQRHQQGFQNQQQQLGSAFNFLQQPMHAYERASDRALGTNRYNQYSDAQNMRMLFDPLMQGGYRLPGNGGGGMGVPPQQGGGFDGPEDYSTPEGGGTNWGWGNMPNDWSTPAVNGQGQPWQDYSPFDVNGMPQYQNDNYYPDLYGQL